MCAGSLPFPDEGEVLDQKIMAGAWTSPPHFSANLRALLSRLIEPNWDRRYSSVAQIRSHIWVRDVQVEREKRNKSIFVRRRLF